MAPDHDVPIVFGHIDEHPIAQDARVVHQDVDPAPGLDPEPDGTLGAIHRRDVVRAHGDRYVQALELRGDRFDHRGVGSGAVSLCAGVVDDHRGSLGREPAGVLAAHPAARTGDHGNPSLEGAHGGLPYTRGADAPQGIMALPDQMFTGDDGDEVVESAECAECVVPRPTLGTLLLDTLRRHAPAIRAIALVDPRESGST